MTEPLVHLPTEPWTVDDLDRLPDTGVRYELVDGSLLVSPHPFAPHSMTIHRLRKVLERQSPVGIEVINDIGLHIDAERTYFVPDLVVAATTAADSAQRYLQPADLWLVVEVLSKDDSGTDLVTKRHYYAHAAIPRYWIVDRQTGTLTVLALDGKRYVEEVVVQAGESWSTDEPFPLTLDPADVC
jgi:Uma2 family endonuclease